MMNHSSYGRARMSQDLYHTIGTKRRLENENSQWNGIANKISKNHKYHYDSKHNKDNSELNCRLQTVLTQLAAGEERLLNLEADLKLAQKGKDSIEKNFNELRTKFETNRQNSTELAGILRTLETAVEEQTKQNHVLETENKEMKIYADRAEMDVANQKEQNQFLSDRNAVLAKKCESLLANAKKVEAKNASLVEQLEVDKKLEKLRIDDKLNEIERLNCKCVSLESELKSCSEAEKFTKMELIGLEEALRKSQAEMTGFEVKLGRIGQSNSIENARLKRDLHSLKSHIDGIKRYYERKVRDLDEICQNLQRRTDIFGVNADQRLRK